MAEKKHHKLTCVFLSKNQTFRKNKQNNAMNLYSLISFDKTQYKLVFFANSFFFLAVKVVRQSVKVYSLSLLRRWDSLHWSAYMRLSNYIYCTLTPSVCRCSTRCYATLPACSHMNTPNSYCHVQFALTHIKAIKKKKNAACFTLVCTTHLDCNEQTLLPDSCNRVKIRTRGNLECKTAFPLLSCARWLLSKQFYM